MNRLMEYYGGDSEYLKKQVIQIIRDKGLGINSGHDLISSVVGTEMGIVGNEFQMQNLSKILNDLIMQGNEI